MSLGQRVLYFADVEPGGLADYALHQAVALQRAGASVTMLGLRHLQDKLHAMCGEIRFIPLHERPRALTQWGNALRTIGVRRRRVQELCDLIEAEDFKHILLTAYSEYFAPLWVRRLQQKHRAGIWFGVILHDPIRDFCLGPVAWHRYSVKQAFSYINRVYTHGTREIDTGLACPPPVTCIPHGPYHYPDADSSVSKAELRKQFGIPANAKVLLSFGHIRDSKHLALMIESLASLPNHHLLIAGREQSSGQKPAAWYQELASRLGVQDRCHWHNEFIPDKDVWRYFRAADILMLLYKSSFRSASGVLSANVQFGIPVVASGGDGPLKENIRDYGLGIWLDSPNVKSLSEAVGAVSGLQILPATWASFDRDNSWERNAALILESMAN